MAKQISSYTTHRVKRKGVHSKNTNSNQPNSKVYRKKYRGQGR